MDDFIKGELHKRVSNYTAFLHKGTELSFLSNPGF
jgi:hypothetical protein